MYTCSHTHTYTERENSANLHLQVGMWFHFFFFFQFLSVFLFWWAGSLLPCGLSPGVASGGCPLCGAQASHCCGFSCCEVRAQWLWHMGLVAPWDVESSWTKDWTYAPCIGRWILNHWTTREVPWSWIFMLSLTSNIYHGIKEYEIVYLFFYNKSLKFLNLIILEFS